MNERSVRKRAVLGLVSRFGAVSTMLSAPGAAGLMTAAALVSATAVHAQSNADGYIFGQVPGAPDGLTVVATDTSTGLTRTSSVDGRGNFRLPQLPVGRYTVTLTRGGEVLQTRENVQVSIGSGSPVRFSSGDDVVQMERFVVGAASIAPIDVSQTEVVSIYRQETLNLVPVPRDTSSVALLAPGTVEGDPAFAGVGTVGQRLVSFGGSSVAENTFYVNGFNVTNFRNGLGGSTVPFAFYEEFNIKKGGYSAEFGRSTGGVVNTTTKSGSNEYRSGASVYFEPDALRADQPDVFLADGTPYVINSYDETEALNWNVYASGPLWKNRIFFYGLYNGRELLQNFVGTNADRYYKRKSDDPFYGAKLDFNITNDHRLEATHFSDEREGVETAYDYTYSTRTRGDNLGDTVYKRGGKNSILRYTGNFTETFSLSALWGRGEYSLTDAGAGDDIPYVLDSRTGAGDQVLTGATQLAPSVSSDEREALRIDGSLNLWNHQIRFGYDTEENTSEDLTQYSGGGVYWRYFSRAPGSTVGGGTVPAGVNEVVRERIYRVGGTFGVENEAYYIEDNFTIFDDRLRFSLGLRNETFTNSNKNNEPFVEIDNQIAPRLAASYDLRGDGTSKVFANFGRYHLPVASNTNVRMAGGELFTEAWFALNSVGADGLPAKGGQIGTTTVYSDGMVQDPRTQTNLEMDPMYQDEIILGYQAALGKNWTFGVRGIYRDLKSAMDDIIINPALKSWAQRNNVTYVDPGFEAYVLTNPGKPIRMFWDINADGTLEEVNLTTADLGFPEAKRKYYAAEFTLERSFNRWFLQGSYTWSQSYGNTEGYVNSDLGQDDAGITANFDKPALTVNTYGFLPNDRRHALKALAAYQLTKELTLGGSFTTYSGRPINKLGNNPDGSAGYASDFLLVPRGTAGRLPTIVNLDLSLTYRPQFLQERLALGLDVFNVFNFDKPASVNELSQQPSGAVEPKYLRPTTFQAPRYVRLSASFDF